METDSVTLRSVVRSTFTTLHFRSETRNDLAIFLRDTQHLKNIYIPLWRSGPLINQKATHLDLLEVLPKLHIELLECTSTIG